MKRVLIAHQSTIPHYRIPFYNTLEQLRPLSWQFDVVFDPSEPQKKRFFQEPIDMSQFQFPILPTRTYSLTIKGRRYSYQTFWQQAAQYDLIIVEDALNNLTYPLCQAHQLWQVKYALWGHGKDRKIVQKKGVKAISEKVKMALIRRADGFFAYTPGVKSFLVERGLAASNIFVLNNTLDIQQQRHLFAKWQPSREEVRQQLGIAGKNVLLFVGRFRANKRLDFLLDAFTHLLQEDKNFHLLLVGGDKTISHPLLHSQNISILGTVVEPDGLARLYTASDLLVYPGAVGLAPLQAFCYDLPVVSINYFAHGPEVEYLSPANALMLPADTSPEQLAQTIRTIFASPEQLLAWHQTVWPSVSHLTIEQMTQNFIGGVNQLLLMEQDSNE